MSLYSNSSTLNIWRARTVFSILAAAIASVVSK